MTISKKEFEDTSNAYDIQVKATDLGRHLFESLTDDEKGLHKKKSRMKRGCL